MTVTPVTSRATGYVVGASEWNAALVDNMNWVTGDAPSCKAYVTTAQLFLTGVQAVLNFDGEVWDVTGMHSTTVNNSRFTVPVTGRYEITACIRYPAAAFNGFIEPFISGITTSERAGMTFSASADYGINASWTFTIAAGGYVELVAWHNFGSSLNLYGTCTVKWVGR